MSEWLKTDGLDALDTLLGVIGLSALFVIVMQ
jgi:hypothetical protein